MGQYSSGPPVIAGEFDLPNILLNGFTDSGLFSINRGFGLSLAAQIVYLQTLGLWQVGSHALPTGVLTALAGGPTVVPANMQDLCADPSGKFLYQCSLATNQVYAFLINPVTGALTAVAGSPFAAGAGTSDPAVSPNGKFLYVTNQTANTVSAYTINQVTGALTPVAGSPFATGNSPGRVAINPSGTFAYVANQLGNSVSAYTINQVSGALTPVAGSPFATGLLPVGVTVHPAGQFCYVTNYNSATVSAYFINQVTGVLTPVLNSPFTSGINPNLVVTDPLGRFMYVSCAGSNNVWAYDVDNITGALTPVVGSPFVAGAGAFGLAIDPAGEILCVTNFTAGTISTFTINDITGFLTPVVGSPFAAAAAKFITIDPTGKFCYVGGPAVIYGFSTSSTIQLPLLEGTFDQSGANQNRLNVNGQLMLNGTLLGAGIPLTTGNAGKFLKVDPTATTTVWDTITTVLPVVFAANAAAATVDDSSTYILNMTGALTAPATLTLTMPAGQASLIVMDNATTGNFAITTNPGGFNVPSGESIWYWNGATLDMISQELTLTTIPIAMVANAGAVNFPTNGIYNLEITGALTAAGTITPTLNGVLTELTINFDNATTGGFTVNIAGFTIPPGKTSWYYNGATFEIVSARGFTTAQVTPLSGLGVQVTINHLCGAVPFGVNLEAICLTAEQNYTVGDVVEVNQTFVSAVGANPQIWKNATQCGLLSSAGNDWVFANKTTGAAFVPTLANWAYRFVINP